MRCSGKPARIQRKEATPGNGSPVADMRWDRAGESRHESAGDLSAHLPMFPGGVGFVICAQRVDGRWPVRYAALHTIGLTALYWVARRRFSPRARAVPDRPAPLRLASFPGWIGETGGLSSTTDYPRARATSANPAICAARSKPVCPWPRRGGPRRYQWKSPDRDWPLSPPYQPSPAVHPGGRLNARGNPTASPGRLAAPSARSRTLYLQVGSRARAVPTGWIASVHTGRSGCPPGQPDAQRVPGQPLPPCRDLRGVRLNVGDLGRN